ncbi:Surfactin synthase thioesterase subunit [Seinonella peptonophila]|uniref:Surfactin synthase thioesterase subunit n=1 Tax=Seinonella peptonophila TaxID=112248 RepID=A0A1M5BF82_9BACL|nr:alpha/beta fold hydrolase [Seinonella peptonophila]SHF40822.1 Surfactin synthase thioesterase subunit [Seinonella peptonophila]
MDSPWFPFNHQVSTCKERFFCFPYGGGNPQFYRAWQNKMPQGIEIVPVQLPGRGMRFHEQNIDSVDQLIEILAREILHYLDRPFFFFGHSFGSLISYELASFLHDQYQKQPNHLFVSGYHAPHLPDPNPPIYHLPDDQFIDEVIAKNGMPKEILAQREYLDVFLPCLRADFTAAETYQHKKRKLLTCPITIFGGKDDHEADFEHLEAWKELTTGAFEKILFPGDHFFIHSAENELIDTIVNRLRFKRSHSS